MSEIKQIQIGEDNFTIKDEIARSEVNSLENDLNQHIKHNWFIIADSYGRNEYTGADNFLSLLNSNGYVYDSLAVNGMGFGNAIKCETNLQAKINTMSSDTKSNITDVLICLGVNDATSGYNAYNTQLGINNSIQICEQNFANLKQIHFAPIGNLVEVDTTARGYIDNLRDVHKIVKQACAVNKKCVYVENTYSAMNNPYYFKENDGTHPSTDGSLMLFNNVSNYIKNGIFPKNRTILHVHEDGTNTDYRMVCDGDSLSWTFEQDTYLFNSVTLRSDSDGNDIIYAAESICPSVRAISSSANIIVAGQFGTITLHQNAPGQLGAWPKTNRKTTMLLGGHIPTIDALTVSEFTANHIKCYFQGQSNM